MREEDRERSGFLLLSVFKKKSLASTSVAGAGSVNINLQKTSLPTKNLISEAGGSVRNSAINQVSAPAGPTPLTQLLQATGSPPISTRVSPSPQLSQEHQVERALFIRSATITACYLACWIPMAVHIVEMTVSGTKADPLFAALCYMFVMLNASLNAIIFVLSDARARSVAVKLMSWS